MTVWGQGRTPAGDSDNEYVAGDSEEGDQEADIEQPSVASTFDTQILDKRSEPNNEAGREGRLERLHLWIAT